MYHFVLFYDPFSVLFLSSLDKKCITFRSKRYEPFITFRKILPVTMHVRIYFRQRFSESVWYCQVYLGHLRPDLSSLISRRDFLQMAILVSLAFEEVILDMWSMFILHPIWHQLPLLLITITTWCMVRIWLRRNERETS